MKIEIVELDPTNSQAVNKAMIRYHLRLAQLDHPTSARLDEPLPQLPKKTDDGQ